MRKSETLNGVGGCHNPNPRPAERVRKPQTFDSKGSKFLKTLIPKRSQRCESKNPTRSGWHENPEPYTQWMMPQPKPQTESVGAKTPNIKGLQSGEKK